MRIALAILILFLLSSCKKLESEQVFLNHSCEECKEFVESYFLSNKGVHYVNYDHQNEVLTVHYDKGENSVEIEAWLINKGFVQVNDSSEKIIPACCQLIDTLNIENGN